MLSQRKNSGRSLSANLNAGQKNHLLAALPKTDLIRLQTKFEPISLNFGEVLYEPGDTMEYLYFPTTAIISLLCLMENGATVEVGVIGNDGAVGIGLLIGDDTTLCRIFVRNEGKAVRVNAAELQTEFRREGEFQSLLLRFTLALLAQIAQTSACNRLHSIEQHLCSWLLLTYDRAASNKLLMTHEFISSMLGVRREYITLAIKKLQEKKMISNMRGVILLTDRQAMEIAACECYQIIRDEYIRLLGKGFPQNFR